MSFQWWKWCESEVLDAQSCPTPCHPMDCSPPGSPAHGILQARILEWVAIPFSRGSSWSRDRTQVSCITGKFFTIRATREVHLLLQRPNPEQQEARLLSMWIASRKRWGTENKGRKEKNSSVGFKLLKINFSTLYPSKEDDSPRGVGGKVDNWQANKTIKLVKDGLQEEADLRDDGERGWVWLCRQPSLPSSGHLCASSRELHWHWDASRVSVHHCTRSYQ